MYTISACCGDLWRAHSMHKDRTRRLLRRRRRRRSFVCSLALTCHHERVPRACVLALRLCARQSHRAATRVQRGQAGALGDGYWRGAQGSCAWQRGRCVRRVMRRKIDNSYWSSSDLQCPERIVHNSEKGRI